MSGLRTLFRLPQTEQRLIVWALLIVTFVRLGLWLIAVRQLQRLLESSIWLIPQKSLDVRIDRLVWAVQASSRRVPMATCLTQSLSLYYMLLSAGLPSMIRFGVSKNLNEGFQAHAWVEYLGQPLLSSVSEVEKYVSLHGGD